MNWWLVWYSEMSGWGLFLVCFGMWRWTDDKLDERRFEGLATGSEGGISLIYFGLLTHPFSQPPDRIESRNQWTLNEQTIDEDVRNIILHSFKRTAAFLIILIFICDPSPWHVKVFVNKFVRLLCFSHIVHTFSPWIPR